MSCNCNNGIVADCLAIYFDISNPKTWGGNPNFTIKSMTEYCDTIADTIQLNDYGLTMYDVGRVNSLSASTSFDISDRKLNLIRIAYNDASGNTYNSGYSMSNIFDVGIGSYFSLSGGYVQNFFKLEGYEYELLPSRFEKGFTIETWVKIDEDTFTYITGFTDGTFIYLGSRAENKYSTLFSGDSTYRTSSGGTLGPDSANFKELGVYGNNLAFKFNSDKTLSYRYIDDIGLVKDCSSTKQLTTTGWTCVTISWTADKVVKDFFEVKDCYPRRTGNLNVYINGNKFWTVPNFPEMILSGLTTQHDKQIGVPYVLSWGGGTFGLKHSWNYDPFFRKNNINKIIDGDFNSGSTSGLSSYYSLSADPTTYIGSSGYSLSVYNSNTGVTFDTFDLVSFTGNTINILPNKRYEIILNVKNDNLLPIDFDYNNITLDLVGLDSSTGSTLVSKSISGTTWINSNTLIQTSTGLTSTGVTVTPTIKINGYSLNDFNNIFNINFDDIQIYEYDYIENIYKQNPENQNLLIQKAFDGSFYGGIQILRFYICPLTPTQIKNNFNAENVKFGIPSTQGGRIIYI